MTNHITDLLNLKDSDIQIKSISTHGNIKEITLEKEFLLTTVLFAILRCIRSVSMCVQ